MIIKTHIFWGFLELMSNICQNYIFSQINLVNVLSFLDRIRFSYRKVIKVQRKQVINRTFKGSVLKARLKWSLLLNKEYITEDIMFIKLLYVSKTMFTFNLFLSSIRMVSTWCRQTSSITSWNRCGIRINNMWISDCIPGHWLLCSGSNNVVPCRTKGWCFARVSTDCCKRKVCLKKEHTASTQEK